MTVFHEGLRASWEDVSLVTGHYASARDEYGLSPVPENTLTIGLAGVSRVYRRMKGADTWFDFRKGDIFQQEAMSPADGFRWDGVLEMVHIFIQPALFERAERAVFGSNAGRTRYTCATPFQDEGIFNSAKALLDEAQNPSPGACLMTRAIAERLSLQLLRFHLANGATTEVTGGSGLDDQGMRALRTYAMEHLSGDLSLEKLSSVVDLGVPHFATLFRKSFGITPHDWVMQLRLDRAIELLRGSEFSLAEIAERSGFADQSHFTRRFKQRFGTSPLKWRNGTPEVTRRNTISVNADQKGVQDSV